MMSFKRSTCILLVLVLMSISVIGCSPAQVKDTAEPAETKTEAKAEENIEYPTTNINCIVGWGAGGGSDTIARTVSPKAQEILGKSIIINNKGGASGTIAHQYVYDQKEDGYTILFGTAEPTIFQVLGLSNLSYNEFEPAIILVSLPGVLIVHKDSPYNTFEDFINDAIKRPEEITMGLTGVGALPYMASLIINKVTGAKFNSAYYDGDGPLVTSLMGKQIDATVVGAGAATQYIKSGDFKGLAIISNDGIEAIPNVPALGDLVPDAQDELEVTGPFFGIYLKKGTPQNIIDKVRDAYKASVEDPKFVEFCKNSGYSILGLTGDDAKAFISGWQSQSAWLIHEAGAAKESPEKFGIPKLNK